MSDFLETMAARSRERARASKAKVGSREIAARIADLPPAPVLELAPQGFDLIAEVKRRSPSEGELSDGRDHNGSRAVSRRAQDYARGGAAAISVLTEPTAFGGSLDDLAEVARTVRVPVMRKDFLVDSHQIEEARAAGAGGVLLIARILDDAMLAELPLVAMELGLFVLLEAFDAHDLERIGTLLRGQDGSTARALSDGGPILVGLNSRDLKTLHVDPHRFERLAHAFPKDSVRVAESGLQHPEDVAGVAGLGYSVGLVGSALMRSTDPAALVAEMLAAARSEAQA